MELKALNTEMWGAVTEDMCQQVITSIGILVSEAARQNSWNIEHVIHKS